MCSKRKYNTKFEAELFAAALIKLVTPIPSPKYAYWCEECKCWHLTRKPQ